MLTVVYFQYVELEEVHQLRKRTSYDYVAFKDGSEGIRIVPSDRVIMKNDVSEDDWKGLLKLVGK
ncbi:hypothetical protein [Bacillus sp. AK128]